jgi:predicted O-linked N-acetylglucosamine transferase (SPINDLY family)
MGRFDEAAEALREAIRLQPSLAPAHMNLGAVLAQQGQLEAATAAFETAATLAPADPRPLVNLGHCFKRRDRIDESIAAFRKAVALAPDLAQAYSMLGSSLREAADISEAIASFRKAIAIRSQYREAHSNLAYAMHFDPDATPESVLAEHRTWAGRFAEPLRQTIRPHDNDRAPGRRLRVGYVSPYLGNHVIGFFMEPILLNHNRADFEVFCYSDGYLNDAVAERLRGVTDVWRQTTGMGDEDLARLIRDDRIDVLVDLTLHMRGSRLTLFARKPAPVQISHLAYCGTSGMSAMDWCITDANMSPPGLNDAFFTERLLRLPQSYWCYRPPSAGPEIGTLPAEKNGVVTFGSLNSFAKVNDRVIALWRQVLEAVPGSRLLVHALGGEANRIARARFARLGVAPDRLTLVGRQPLESYFNQYNAIDIALDPFPYGGGTTSLDALWMGVPLVTLAGRMPVGRTGVTLLSNVGLSDLIANGPAEYVHIAAGLAANLQRLAELRRVLRGRLESGPLMDARRYTRDLESAYRSAWQDCYARHPVGSG